MLRRHVLIIIVISVVVPVVWKGFQAFHVTIKPAWVAWDFLRVELVTRAQRTAVTPAIQKRSK